MECSDIRRHLSAYIDNECPEEIRQAVASHLESCGDCRREYEELKALSRRLRELPEQELPFDFASVMAEKLREEERLRPRKKPVYKRTWARVLELCACLALVVCLASVVGNVFKGAGAPAPADMALYEEENSSARGYEEPAATTADEAEAATAAEAEDMSDASAESDALQRKIITNWYLSLEVDDPEAAYKEIERVAADYGGYVVGGNTYCDADGNYRGGNIAIRVEAERAQQAVDEITALGRLQSSDFSSQDVTGEYYDTAARLTAYEAQEQRLLELYDQAASVSETLEIECQLTAVRAQIESLQGTVNYYDQLTALSLIEIDLSKSSDYSQTVEPRGWRGFLSRLKSGFLTGLNNTLDGLAGFLVWLARALPLLLLLAAVIVLAVFLVRRKRKGKR